MTSALSIHTIGNPRLGSWRWLGNVCLITLVIVSMLTLQSCSLAQWEEALNAIAPAVANIIEIVSIVRGTAANSTIVPKIQADVQAIEQLGNDFQTAEASAQPGISGKINAAIAVFQADLADVYTLANVNDPASQNKITELVDLILSDAGIVIALLPGFTGSAVAIANSVRIGKEHGRVITVDPTLTVRQALKAYNAVLVVKTGNKDVDKYTAKHQVHVHNAFLRFFGAD
jgi:hypothetical protein